MVVGDTDLADMTPDRWTSLPVCRSRCLVFRLRVATRRIGYVNAILESYEWIARIQTEDRGSGILRIDVPEDWEEVFRMAADDLSKRTGLEMLSDPRNAERAEKEEA